MVAECLYKRFMSRNLCVALSCLFFSLLTACGGFRDPPSLKQPLSARFAEGGATGAPLLSKNWWRTDDEVLGRIIKEIEMQNLSLAQARERLITARLPLQTGDYLPNLTAAGEVQYSRTLQGTGTNAGFGFFPYNQGQHTTGYYNTKLDATWELPLYGQYRALDQGDKAEVAIAEADIDQVHASTIAEAVRLYGLLKARLQLEQRLAMIVTAQRHLLEYALFKQKAGLLTNTDLGNARQALENVQQEAGQARSASVEAAQQLAGLLGKTAPEPEWEEPSEIPVLSLPPLGDTPLDVLSRRPDIRSARAAVEHATAELSIAKSEMYPTFSLSGSLSQLDNVTGTPLLGKSVQLGGIPSVSIPLFDWGKRLNTAKQKYAALAETAFKYRETVVNAMNEVERFFAAYHAAENTVKTAQASLISARDADRDAELLQKAGIADGAAWQNADIARLRSENSVSGAQADQVASLAALAKALGGGVDNTKQQVRKEP